MVAFLLPIRTRTRSEGVVGAALDETNRFIQPANRSYSDNWAKSIRSDAKLAVVEKVSSASFQAVGFLASSRAASSLSSLYSLLSFLKPYRTHRKRPPAAYCVMDIRVSPSWRGVFPCGTVAEGIRAVAPPGNSIINRRCSSTR